ncbi:MAG: xanthine dehydrogenase family protein molybdopterin-binding subunit [Kordiimonadaceae bacterium]|nr:xanthine dehydrogenase family protein molybdopterin-binding subunit [Kordiimonadaceae bacterium]
MAEKLLGNNFTPPDVRAKVTGASKYSEDVRVDGMCYIKMLGNPMPSSNVTIVDTSEALAMKGVLGILTENDVPPSPPPGYPILTNKPRQLGQPILAIAAENEAIAAEALEKIKVNYEAQPFSLDPLQSLYPGGPNALEEGNISGGRSIPLGVLKWTARDFAEAGETRLPMGEAPEEWAVGDVEAAFKDAAFIIDEPFVVASSSHQALEPRSTLSYWENGKCFVYGSSQSQSWMMPGLAAMLQIPVEDVVYIAEFCGGGFGAKASPYPTMAIPAYMSKKIGRPCMLRITRAEEYHIGGSRPGFQGQLKVGFDKKGKVTAIDCYIVQSGGPSNGSGDYTAAAEALALVYTPTNMRFRGVPVVTNKPFHISQRGPGQNQIACIMEPFMDRAAKQLGIDRIMIREINAPDHDVVFSDRESTVTSSYIRDALIMGSDKFKWKEKIALSGKRNGNKVIGIGVGQAYHSAGSNGFDGLVTIRPDGKLHIHSGVGNLGTYSYASASRIAAETLGCSWENTVIEHGDSRRGLPWVLAQFGSNTTFTTTRTNFAAANDAKQKLKEIAAMDLGGAADDYEVDNETVFLKSDPSKVMTFAQAATRAIELGGKYDGHEFPDELNAVTKAAMPLVAGLGLCGVAKDNMPKKGTVPALATGYAMIELDTETGKYEILEYTAFVDCGSVIHPQSLEQQVRGGGVMGMGMAATDRMVYDPQNGLCATVDLYHTKPLTILDIPSNVEVGAVNKPDPQSPAGVKGVGEPVMGCAAAAILSAIQDATGHSFNRTPVDPDMIVNAMAGRPQSFKPLQVNI